jgi:hypothetical protein
MRKLCHVPLWLSRPSVHWRNNIGSMQPEGFIISWLIVRHVHAQKQYLEVKVFDL